MGDLGYIIGMVLAKVLSLAGAGSFVVGLFMGNVVRAVVAGMILGILDTIILTQFRIIPTSSDSWIFAILVGATMGAVGFALKRAFRGASAG